MKKINLNPGDISKILSDNINDKNSIFVFPTDVVMNSWTDWIITHPEKSGTTAIATEQFTAWDNFKSDFVSAQQKDKNVIPSILRKMFIIDLITRNADKSTPENEKFKIIINPNYAKEATSFADWLCDTLRSLHFWKTRIDKHVPEEQRDSEDQEYCRLYNMYCTFLEKNNLFEPSWVEDIEFEEKKKKFHIFYPELLEDFSDYIEIFEKVSNIIIYKLPNEDNSLSKETKSPYAYLYPDSRKELRQTMLSIINIVKSSGGKTDWSNIALSIPDIETYRPYIEREFNLYGIPYVIKAGVSLTKNAAGRIFREIQDCYNSSFSYDSVRTLLLDECMPWKEDINEKKEKLIREGSRMRCICSVNDDIWIKAFSQKINYLNKNSDNKGYIEYFIELKNFYELFKDRISRFFPKSSEKNTFENIRTSWMSFKETFFDEEKFTEDANNILSRCIVELGEIIDIEKKYSQCNLLNLSPYSFFLQELDKKTYTKQTSDTGVNIFPYKLSAAAYFKYQFVIDGSQKNLDVSYKRLTYLSNKKREALKLTEDDKINNSSNVFIKLYAKNTEMTNENFVHFSAATDSFSGFAIPHSSLMILDEDKNPDYDNDDYILKEKEIIKNASGEENIKLTQSQKDSYENWKKAAINDNNKNYHINEKISNSIESIVTSKNNKIKISARGAMEQFFPCPRKWIFSSVLNIQEDSLDTDLMNIYDMGNLNHKIMESFMNIHMEKRLPFFDKDNNIFKIKDESDINTYNDYSEEINNIFYGKENIVEKAIKTPRISLYKNDSKSDYRDSPLAIEALLSQKKKIADKIVDFLKKLLLPYGKGKFTQARYTTINGIGNCIVKGVEDELYYEKNNFVYFGRIDCYLLNPDNNWVIIDYKNSDSSIPSNEKIHVTEDGILENFQMPVYYKLISNNKKNEIDAGYFYAIKTGNKRKATDKEYEKAVMNGTDTIAERDFDFSETLSIIDDYGQLFCDTVISKNFAPYFTEDKKDKKNVIDYKNCIDCPYKSICRTTYTIAGKKLLKK